MTSARFTLRDAPATRRANAALARITATVDGDPALATAAAGLLEEAADALDGTSGYWVVSLGGPIKVKLDYVAVERAQRIRSTRTPSTAPGQQPRHS